MKIKEKFFCGEIQRDLDELKKKRKKWQGIPKFTDFGEENARNSVYEDPDGALLDYFVSDLRKGVVVYDSEALKEEAARLRDSLMDAERDEILETIAKDKAEKVVRDIIESNFKRIQAEVKGIIDRECRQPQDIRMVDPFT